MQERGLPMFKALVQPSQIVAVDLKPKQEELRLLEMIRDAFSIDPRTTAAIETPARIRHRRL